MKARSQTRRLGRPKDLATCLFALGLAAGIAPFAHAQTIFQNFTGTTFDQAGDGVPPDTMGAMGLNNQFSEFINGSFANFNTSTGSLVSRVTDTAFWNNAGISSSVTNAGLSDPRIVFDKASQRWFASEITVANTNAYLVAVSNSADLASGFKGYTFQANPTTGSQNIFADYDMLGVNGDGVYISSNNFSNSNGNDVNSSILSISKAGLLAESAAPASNLFYANNPNGTGNGTGFLPHPVTDLDTTQATGKEYFLSNYNSSVVSLSSLTGPGSNPAGQTLTALGGNVTIASNPEPNNASQPGAPNSIQTNDSRFSGAVVKKNGYLWGVQETQQNSHAALHWEQIDPATSAVVHQGFITDTTHDYYFGSIAVNDSGDVVIGYTRSGATEDPSAYASVGKITASGLTLGSPISLKESSTPYTGFDGSPYRWGDYSNTVVDPSDPSKFWTVQEYSGSDGNYETQITGIQVNDNTSPAPEPAQVATLSMIGLGLGGLLLRARKRKAAAQPA